MLLLSCQSWLTSHPNTPPITTAENKSINPVWSIWTRRQAIHDPDCQFQQINNLYPHKLYIICICFQFCSSNVYFTPNFLKISKFPLLHLYIYIIFFSMTMGFGTNLRVHRLIPRAWVYSWIFASLTLRGLK